VQEREGITAPFRGHEPGSPRSAQMVNHEKDLVPREVGAATRDVFKGARAGVKHAVDHLIFCGDFLRHVPPGEKRNALLVGESCIAGAMG
jgi:hypothetical protein